MHQQYNKQYIVKLYTVDCENIVPCELILLKTPIIGKGCMANLVIPANGISLQKLIGSLNEVGHTTT